MILEISTTHVPATDLGYLLHKNPDRIHTAEMTFGEAKVFFPEASPERCTAELMIEVDPVKLVRGRSGPSGEGGLLEQYVNDRPYVASSFLSSAIGEFFSTAMGGRSKERPELAAMPIPLAIRIPVLACRGGESLFRRFFEPLGYEIEAKGIELDETFPDWGASHYLDVTLRITALIKDVLAHLYVLIPVLDNNKHYWVGEDEVQKLLRRGKGWLESHPEKELISKRYLAHQRNLTRLALAHLSEAEGDPDPDAQVEEKNAEEEKVERKLSLHEQRLSTVFAALKASGAHRVIDLGCGEGKLLTLLLKDKQFTEIVGVDVVFSVLERAKSWLRLDRLPSKQLKRIKLIHGSLMYRDNRLAGYDAAAVVEVIEHLDEPRLASFERTVFEFARPGTVVITTPNQEYNALFEGMAEGAMRHRDHRFEWTRAQFQDWANGVAEKHGYTVRFAPIGPEDAEKGAPSQMGVFTRGA
ncbi:MAG: 3' terminal RNA ribose 2'-O-methyltransferase Hen1 [Armatimonadetes bacterium 55-13]|nr:3' terminal RNA ribose 2'-O-methyltransferase Hen1 [Armatimonadota bacterium]OJU65508.1 MAG: 3' terminal RNA ribose 2'-O-methyltransferase Hen1 [Armatimonadetes bacterium 55-13]